MTKAKRYEGEALRAERWHNMSRDKAWAIRNSGKPELERIVHNKFDVYCWERYDPVDCGYIIVTEVAVTKPPPAYGVRAHRLDELVLTHEEPCLEFPSDHLKTKLLLLVG